jgi:ATP adenylyltransferase
MRVAWLFGALRRARPAGFPSGTGSATQLGEGLKQLWTPWRLEYILAAKQDSCIFCDFIQQDVDRDPENLILLRGELSFLILNKYPYNNGHLMAVPYHHADSLDMLHLDEQNDLMAMTSLGIRALRRAMSPDGFNIGYNIGKVAGAGVKDHVHCHIVPRWNGDTNYMPVLADVRVIPQALIDTYRQLHQALADLGPTNLASSTAPPG